MQTIDYSGRKTYNVTTNGIVTIPGKFVLDAIVVNTKGGSSNTCAIYDSTATQGTDPANKKGTLDTNASVGDVQYGFPMFNGIYLVVGGGTTPDLTIVYEPTP